MKRSILSPALMLFILSVLPARMLAQDLNSAIMLTRSEQYDKAATMLQDLIKKEPGNGKNFFYLGENILAEFYSDTISNSLAVAAKEAESIYQKGSQANPNEPLNYVGLAKVAFLQGDDKTAEEMRAKAKSFLAPYKKVSKKMSPPAPEYAFILAKIAESYIDQMEQKVDSSKALPLVREAIKIDPGRDVYLIAGDIYILKNEGSKAIQQYNLAQAADPTSPTAAMKIGNIYFKGRAYQPAIAAYEEAIQLNVNYAPAYRELGQVYLTQNKFAEAKTNFEKYLQLTAGNIPARIRYVNALYFAKDYESVIKNVEEIFKVDQSRGYMNRIAGYSAYEKNPPDYNLALSYMERLFKTVAPERILWKDYQYLARILVKRNADFSKLSDDLDKANQQLEKEKGRYSSAPKADKEKIKAGMTELQNRITDLQGKISTANAEIDRAVAAYNKIFAYKPGDKATLNELGNMLYTFKRYNESAKIYARLLDPSKDNTEEMMRIGKTFYTGGNYKSADSLFTEITKTHPDYVPAYLWIANTYSRMDPDSKQGLAKPKFEKVLQVAQKDSVTNAAAMADAITYLGYYHMVNDNLSTAKAYYNRLANLSDNKDYKIRGYYNLASIESQSTKNEKTSEGRLPYLQRAREYYNRILGLDPNNAQAKTQLSWIADYEAQIKKGINPNEIKGVVTNSSGQPVAYASIRVKDTAAETLTNTKGEFKFEIPTGVETLIVSAKGYTSVEVPITKTRVYNVELQ